MVSWVVLFFSVMEVFYFLQGPRGRLIWGMLYVLGL